VHVLAGLFEGKRVGRTASEEMASESGDMKDLMEV
jgi:hypothetical protein